MVNSIYGKTMENLRARRNVEFFLEDDVAQAEKALGNILMKQWNIVIPDKMLIVEQDSHGAPDHSWLLHLGIFKKGICTTFIMI
jgi:hypothetical protein